jgi:hypothetical protein
VPVVETRQRVWKEQIEMVEIARQLHIVLVLLVLGRQVPLHAVSVVQMELAILVQNLASG